MQLNQYGYLTIIFLIVIKITVIFMLNLSADAHLTHQFSLHVSLWEQGRQGWKKGSTGVPGERWTSRRVWGPGDPPFSCLSASLCEGKETGVYEVVRVWASEVRSSSKPGPSVLPSPPGLGSVGDGGGWLWKLGRKWTDPALGLKRLLPDFHTKEI